MMSVLVIGGLLFIVAPVLLGFVASWTASNCYPWRRCGRCGRQT